ncbi:MAG TPA: VCBS domain-containing protein, partial [Telluria sp.]|nr:VCBS domain-containing protein [Telluria sp.]
FTVELDDGNGSTTTQDVTVTITGTNDDVIVTSGAQAGAVTEDTAPGSTTGTIQFTDADLTDEHETNVTSSNATTLGAFVLGTVSESATTTGGSVGWTYTLDNGAAQYLAAGETEEEVFTVELDDGNGSTTTQNVTVTITGTNDDVIVTSGAQTGSVTEDTAPGSATGTIQFTDADLTDEHETNVSSSNATTLGAFVLGAVSESATTTGGSVGWTYTLDNGAAQYLAAGETEEEVFTVELDDGYGSTTTQEVTVTITGTNDAVGITSSAQTGAVTEDSVPSASGTILFTDADLTDAHTTSISSSNATTLGVFALAPVSESATTAAGSVAWTYTLNNTAAQSLASDEEIVETFTVTLDDGHGSTTSQVVSITINGANDVVAVTSGAQSGAVNEDGTLAATGTIAFTDPDLADGHTASVAASPTNSTSLGVLTLGSVSEAAGAANGSVGWTYNLNNAAAQYLAAGQIVTETYVVTIDDGEGSTTTQNVVVTITGAADSPPITDLKLVVNTLPAGNQPPTGSFANFVSVGGSAANTYSMTLSETHRVDGAITDATPDLTLSTAGVLTANGMNENTVYEMAVTVADGPATYLENFSIVTGSNGSDGVDPTVATGDDVIYGLNGTDIIFAGGGDDTVFGQNGSDVIHGDVGNDVLNGGGSGDTFVFDTALNALTNVDTITDFDAGTGSNKDLIRLSAAIFTTLSGGVTSTNFVANAGGDAGNPNQHLLYDTVTKNLYYDADGIGAGQKVLFATLVGVVGTVDITDFIVSPPGP